MTLKIIYFVHGTTTDNEQEISSWRYDVALSELGVRQSIELRDQIKDKHIDIVFCSDLKRATDSANLTFEDRIPIIRDARLRECNYWDLNAGLSSIVEPMQEVNFDKKFPGGESYEDVKERIKAFLDEVREKYDGKTIAIVAHKAPQLSLDVLIKWKSWEQALREDRRKTKSWQPGWEYEI